MRTKSDEFRQYHQGDITWEISPGNEATTGVDQANPCSVHCLAHVLCLQFYMFPGNEN